MPGGVIEPSGPMGPNGLRCSIVSSEKELPIVTLTGRHRHLDASALESWQYLKCCVKISFQTESRCSAVVERQAACPEQIYLRPTTKHSVIGPSEFVERRYPMDRLHQITNEIIRLYREQINFWGLGRTSNLKDADLLQYDRRRDRLNELRRELEGSRKATV